jgi:hypothetical protein
VQLAYIEPATPMARRRRFVMSAVPETIPQPARRSDRSYLDFVEGFREYILGKGADFEARIDAALGAEAARRGEPLQDPEAIRAVVQSWPLGQLRDRLARSQQEMKWHAIRRSFDEQRAARAGCSSTLASSTRRT